MGLKGVLNEEGNLIWAWGMWNRLEKVEFLSEDEIKKRSEEREDINECFCPYKIQPENKGKLVWLSGPPGAGKSTTGQLLGRNSGFVYYEADCAFSCLNPYVPVDVENPTLAGFLQKPVKGIGIEWVRVGKNVEKTFGVRELS